MAADNRSSRENNEPTEDQAAAELNHDTEQISLEDIDKISGGATYTGVS